MIFQTIPTQFPQKGNRRVIETHVYRVPGIADGFGFRVTTRHDGEWHTLCEAVQFYNGTVIRHAHWHQGRLSVPKGVRMTDRRLLIEHHAHCRAFFPISGEDPELDAALPHWFIAATVSLNPEFKRE